MKKLIAGLGLTVLAVPSAQAWTGGIEDMRTMQANERGPVVRVKSHRVTTCCTTYYRHHQGRGQHHATGWQRSAQVAPRPPAQRQAKPAVVRMKAFYVPQPQAQYQQPVRIHRIVGQAQPMCRLVR
ncbi:MAG TPA: hypothetical protein PLE99_16930 [Candidatus Thiothrix moscowensis]|uniref:hypothetical protein n=1 Tax=unclassified Thiothrix TaxID=2636184 RepID=UPI001A18BB18|nr:MULTISPECIES: hypothetical protein [unclassified Thiothrix]MBJ6611952.1 hypothetical protein [Candidatus Thiothrix moscowensis]HRJ54448.1 hypothetical protein [Candidatus Thiothrix moscowensis]HRJ94807.1 hypothetical protein [Candidatus Thiothrix moscowensis]